VALSAVFVSVAALLLASVAVLSPFKYCCGWHHWFFHVLQVIGGGSLLDSRDKEGIELLVVVLLNACQVRHIHAAIVTKGAPFGSRAAICGIA
jgi:hypothetical protein